MNSIMICDLLEITIITIFLYYCFMWLDKNKEKELLKPILMVIILNAAAWVFELKALQLLFFYITTPGAIIYYLINEKSFRKNHGSVQHGSNKLHFKTDDGIHNTIELIIQEGIYGLCDRKNIVYVLEQLDSLDNLILPSLYLNTRISKEIIKFLIRSTEEDQICSFLIKNTDIIGSMIPFFDDFRILASQDEIQQLLQPLIADTDAIIVLGFHKTHQWAILHKEYGYFNLTTKELFKILHHFLYTGDDNHYDYTKVNKTTISQHSL